MAGPFGLNPKWDLVPIFTSRFQRALNETIGLIAPLALLPVMRSIPPVDRDAIQVLLVEDNPGDVRLIQEAFKDSGLTAQLNIARDGEQALAFLRREGCLAG